MSQPGPTPDVQVGYGPAPAAPYAGVQYSHATGWVAWILFGGLLLVVLGVVHLCVGLVGLLRPEFLGASRAELLLPVGLTALAWVHLLLGIVAEVVGIGLIRGTGWARVSAIVLGCVAAVVNFAFVDVYPVWSVTGIVLAAIVVYAVAAHGAELAEAYGDA
jgi:hypothetical protein